MLPVLILANSQRQRDHWQHEVEATSLKLRLEPLTGALAWHHWSESVQVNPWLLNWRTLSTNVPCHLQDLLRPLPHAAFPSTVRLEEGEGEKRGVRSPLSATVSTVSAGGGHGLRTHRLDGDARPRRPRPCLGTQTAASAFHRRPGRIVRGGRQLRLRLAATWPF